MLVEDAGNSILAQLGAYDRATADWAEEHPAAFYHELLRALMRLACQSAAIERRPGARTLRECGRGLRLGPAFRPRDLQEAGAALLGHALSQGNLCPAEALCGTYQTLLGLSAQVSAGRIGLNEGGHNRRSLGGSFFTPRHIVERLLDVALEPLLGRQGDLLDLRICDPSCGGGVFLVAAARRLAQRLGRQRGVAMEAVLANCIHGVDVDVVAIELCRFALWLEAPTACPPWRFLERSIRCADALLGATPAMAATVASTGRPTHGRHRCDEACRAALGLTEGEPLPAAFHWHLESGDVFSARRSPLPHDATGSKGGFDLVIGNPPFLNRLEDATAAGPALAAFLRIRFRGIIGCYADAATAFLVLGSQLLRPGGIVALIQPQSLLAARDAGPARIELATRNRLHAIWFPSQNIFDASVRICAPVLMRSHERRTLLQRFGDDFAPHPARPLDMDDLAKQETWSPLVSDLLGIPQVRIPGVPRGDAATVGDLALVTADFRDQYYGLRGAVLEDDDVDHPPLVTTGLVDMAHCAWGERPMRFDGQRWLRPRVDLSRLEPELQRWACTRLRPKLLVATQTRVIEAVVDVDGAWLPTTPLISVLPRSIDSLWRLAAALCSPPLAAIAIERHAGAALSAGAIKLSARQVAALPLPAPGAAWGEAADCFGAASASVDPCERQSLLDQCAKLMCAAYGLARTEAGPLLGWWRRRAARVRPHPAAAVG